MAAVKRRASESGTRRSKKNMLEKENVDTGVASDGEEKGGDYDQDLEATPDSAIDFEHDAEIQGNGLHQEVAEDAENKNIERNAEESEDGGRLGGHEELSPVVEEEEQRESGRESRAEQEEGARDKEEETEKAEKGHEGQEFEQEGAQPRERNGEKRHDTGNDNEDNNNAYNESGENDDDETSNHQEENNGSDEDRQARSSDTRNNNGKSKRRSSRSDFPTSEQSQRLPRGMPRRDEKNAGDSSRALSGDAGREGDVTYIHLRVLMSARDAVELIGRRGDTMRQLKERSGCKLNVSDNYPGATERIVNIKGPAEKVAMAAGLMVRILNHEPFDVPSSSNDNPFFFRILMPHRMMGAIIGKGGSNFREIEQQSAAKLTARDQLLPGCDDRYVQIHGVADAVHIAVYYLAMTFVNNQNKIDVQRCAQYDPARSHGNSDAGLGGRHNRPNISARPGDRRSMSPPYYDNGYYRGGGMGGGAAGGGGGGMYRDDSGYGGGIPPPMPPMPPSGPSTGYMPGGSGSRGSRYNSAPEEITRKIFVPNELIGSLIGRGGSKINEIRGRSGAVIRIDDYDQSSPDRVITVHGPPSKCKMAEDMIYDKLDAARRAK